MGYKDVINALFVLDFLSPGYWLQWITVTEITSFYTFKTAIHLKQQAFVNKTKALPEA